MGTKHKTPIKSIRAYCIDCSGGSYKEVKLCTVKNCPLYPYRMGRRPSQTTLDTMNEFYSENTDPAQGFTPKKGIEEASS